MLDTNITDNRYAESVIEIAERIFTAMKNGVISDDRRVFNLLFVAAVQGQYGVLNWPEGIFDS